MTTGGIADTPAAADREFPLRVAAVDIGSNAIRFTAAEFLDRTHRVDLAYERIPVRLGHSAFRTGRLTSENMDVAVEAMASFRRLVETLGVKAHRVVATSAVRESRNGGELAERIRREAGFRVETITGGEEARLVWLAVRDRMTLEGRWMLVDLGGGSLEVSVVRGGGIEWSESHRLGTVRLLEDLQGARAGSEAPASESARLSRLLEEYMPALRLPSLGGDGLSGLIATGGNIEALARLAGVAPDARGVSRLPLGALRETRARLASLSCDERVSRLGLLEDRADVILPAAHIYERVAELAAASRIVVPHVGVKEGVLLDLVADPGIGDRPRS